MKVFLIPGWRNWPDKHAWPKLQKDLEAKGYEAHIFWPNWSQNLTDIMNDFLVFFDENKGDHNILLGFSYGGMVSYRASTLRSFDRLIQCSMASHFREDFPHMSWHHKAFAMLRGKDFRTNWSFEEINANFDTPTIAFYGEKEHPVFKQRANELAASQPDLVIVKGVPDARHNINHPNYYQYILESLSWIFGSIEG